jgi:enamine deaminase RidA (YjgF/YER057c/UK114 family)
MKEVRPATIHKSATASYSVATLTSATSLIHISGQVPRSADGATVAAGDIEAQCRHVFEKLREIVSAVGGTLADICRLQIFVVRREDLPQVAKIRAEYFCEPYPACTAVEVSGLAAPDWLIEVEATAAIDSSNSNQNP